MLVSILLIVTGLLFLVKGADILISSAVAIGKKFNISEFFIGLIIVGFGTSLCELVVSIDAVIKGSPDISVGNVIGSNIANILLVTFAASATSVLKPVKVSTFDLLFHLGSHLIFLAVFLLTTLDRNFGLIFISFFIYYLFTSFQNSSSENLEEIKLEKDFFSSISYKNPLKCGFPVIVFSITITLFGADLTVDSAIKISQILDISDSFVGLTIIALGTSLPEIATSITASKRGKSDMIIGNIIGSNIYNLLLILGFTSLFENFSYNRELLSKDVIILFLSVVFFSTLIFNKVKIGKPLGIICFLTYLSYLYYLFLANF